MNGWRVFAGGRVLRIGVCAGAALVATAADATKISIPKTDPRVTIDIPDGWTVEYTDLGVEFRSPEKESLILAKIMKRDRPTVNAWTRKVLDRMMASAGVTVDTAKAAAPPTNVPSETKAAVAPTPAPVQAASAPPIPPPTMAAPVQIAPAQATAGQTTAKPAQVASAPPLPVPTVAAPAPAAKSVAPSNSGSPSQTPPAPANVASVPPTPPPSVAAPMPATPPAPAMPAPHPAPAPTNVASMPPIPQPMVVAPMPTTPPAPPAAELPPPPMMLVQSSPMSFAPPTLPVMPAAPEQAVALPPDRPIPGNAATPSFAILGGPQVGGDQEPAPAAPAAPSKAPQTIHGLHFQVIGYLGGKLKNQPTDIQLVLFDLSASEVFAVEQQSLPTDNRAVDIISSVTPLKH